MPVVSIVLETYNEGSGADIELEDVLGQLRNQTYPQQNIEVVLVVDADDADLTRRLEERYPWARIAHLKNSTYYGMKIRGMEAATGDIVALADADCDLRPDYVERLVRNYENGADVIVGKVRFKPGSRLSKTFNIFCFAYVRPDKQGRANAFSVNNVAFRREVIENHTFDRRIRRSGGAYLLSRQLCAAGYNVVFDPEIAVFHDPYDLRFQMLMRARSGYEVVSLSRLDDEGVLPETKFRKFGLLAPFLASAHRFLFDLRIIVADRKDLDISLPTIPYFVAASAVIRTIEASAGVFEILKPRHLADRYGW